MIAGPVLAAALVLAGAKAPQIGLSAGLPTATGRPIEVAVRPVEIPALHLAKLALIGAAELRSPALSFGGISGLVVEDGVLTAVTDRGAWLTGLVDLDETDTPHLRSARMAPMTDAEGGFLTRDFADAEGLARADGTLVVAFERHDRLMPHLGGGALGAPMAPDPAHDIIYNQGFEALATLPDGRLLAIAEWGRGHFPAFILSQDGTFQHRELNRRTRFSVTGADLGPDNRLYVVRRRFRWWEGLSIRITRHHLRPDGFPDFETETELAAFESDSGIDNMEGIAVERDPDGGLRLWLIADDNFKVFQRTILMAFRVLE